MSDKAALQNRLIALGGDSTDEMTTRELKAAIRAIKEGDEAEAVDAEAVDAEAVEPAKAIESEDLLQMLAEQRKKTGKLGAYAKQGQRTRRRTRSKIHAQAADKE